MALAQQGDGEGAWRLFQALSPAHRAADPKLGPLYGLEPYVAAGDIYSQPPYAGRGGWSWYTGCGGLAAACGARIDLRPGDRRPHGDDQAVPAAALAAGRADRQAAGPGTTHQRVPRRGRGGGGARASCWRGTVAVGEPIDLDVTGEGQHLVVVMGDRVAAMPVTPSAGGRCAGIVAGSRRSHAGFARVDAERPAVGAGPKVTSAVRRRSLSRQRGQCRCLTLGAQAGFAEGLRLGGQRAVPGQCVGHGVGQRARAQPGP